MDTSKTSIFIEPGTLLGKTYQIIRLLGQGGMGTVYMAYDSSLDLKVAIKVISPKITANEDREIYEVALKRFQAEARIAARIDHPNVIRILGFNRDTIEYQNQTVEVDYLVMELLAGRTLRDTMDESGFEHEDEIKEWIRKYMFPILEGVEKVHNNGIIHRDIKPENFFLKEDKVKLADFGLSMGLDQPSVTGPLVDVLGTLKYMSPEQFYNFSHAREPADIFSLGRILYEVVEGPITERIKPFKQVHLSRADSPFLKALDNVIAKATAETTKERIATARELMNRLSEILDCQAEIREKNVATTLKHFNLRNVVLFFFLGVSMTMAFTFYHQERGQINVEHNEPPANYKDTGVEIINDPLLERIKTTYHASDNSIMQLVPPMKANLQEKTPFNEIEYQLSPFYLSESPITNQQFVSFLNTINDKLEIKESDLLLDGKIILKLSEKIRGYKPIEFNNEKFEVPFPMHSACAVLMVTGYGAKAYADHYDLRLISVREWYTLMASQPDRESARLPLPTPVINYPKNLVGVRGINEIAEWGKDRDGNLVIMGQTASDMIENGLVSVKDPGKYYTDTSFRVAHDLDAQ